MTKTIAKKTTTIRVAGVKVQEDRSGVGHCWVDVRACDLPATIREEIEGEVIEGGLTTCEDMVGSNGIHYRW